MGGGSRNIDVRLISQNPADAGNNHWMGVKNEYLRMHVELRLFFNAIAPCALEPVGHPTIIKTSAARAIEPLVELN